MDRLQGCLGAELKYSKTAWDEAWLWDRSDGFALFDHYPWRAEGSRVIPDSEGWDLTRVWVRPGWRRRGLLTAAWADWEERYGEFRVEAPLSPEMESFLLRRYGGDQDAVDRRVVWAGRRRATR